LLLIALIVSDLYNFQRGGIFLSERRKLYFIFVHIPNLGDIPENRGKIFTERREITTIPRFKMNTALT